MGVPPLFRKKRRFPLLTTSCHRGVTLRGICCVHAKISSLCATTAALTSGCLPFQPSALPPWLCLAIGPCQSMPWSCPVLESWSSHARSQRRGRIHALLVLEGGRGQQKTCASARAPVSQSWYARFQAPEEALRAKVWMLNQNQNIVALSLGVSVSVSLSLSFLSLSLSLSCFLSVCLRVCAILAPKG